MLPMSAQVLPASEDQWLLCLAGILTLCTSSQGLLTTASKAPGGGYAYNFATVPFLAEALKFCISAWLLRGQMRTAPEAAQMTRTWASVMLFPIPSVIYWIHNNVQVLALQRQSVRPLPLHDKLLTRRWQLPPYPKMLCGCALHASRLLRSDHARRVQCSF